MPRVAHGGVNLSSAHLCNNLGCCLQQENAEEFGRDKSPAWRRAVADGAGGMDSPWIERELQTLRAMCESNRRDHDGEQVLTTSPSYNVRFGIAGQQRNIRRYSCQKRQGASADKLQFNAARFLPPNSYPLLDSPAPSKTPSTKQNVIVLE